MKLDVSTCTRHTHMARQHMVFRRTRPSKGLLGRRVVPLCHMLSLILYICIYVYIYIHLYERTWLMESVGCRHRDTSTSRAVLAVRPLTPRDDL